ncbi:hypothetical protein SMD44_p10217 (plasmid) [Streptomyces alboflavus]|uniref:Uncharacterized protein n=1 Tax=Streptomyces alboflavus TaxID=67267 RepID=A0A291W4Y7_9ACTN|nr:hypothetical protein [Streptomyces alboflavus]ATM24716.1 hypothetical protein SMD44_p10217 [Streptomyces alboflavus]
MHTRRTTATPAALAARTVSKPCTRYEHDGTPCGRLTDRRDQWCGTCAGFHRAQRPKPKAAAPRGGQSVVDAPEPLPLEADDAHDPHLNVTRHAIDQYRQRHGGDAQAAETEIRSLLENLITTGDHRHLTRGSWRAWRLQADEGFTLVLSADASFVIGYSTAHRERTYAQVKAAVPSRSRTREKAWVLQLQDDLPIRFPKLVLLRFARDVLGIKFTRSTGERVVAEIFARSQQVLPDPPPSNAGRRRVTDQDGLRWHFHYEPGSHPTVSHLLWEHGRGPEAAKAQAEKK